MFYFQRKVIRINFENFGNYDVSFKWTKITNFSLFINKLCVPQKFKVSLLHIKVIKNFMPKISLAAKRV